MACENENATATYGSLHDAFSAFKRADGAQTSAFGAGKASASAPAPATVHGSLSAAIAASGSLTSEPVAADGVQTAALAPAADAAPVSAPGAAYGAQSSASAAADRAPASSLAAAFKALQRRNADRSGSQATMPVAERFVSINGEGACAGKLAAFIRFTGCNLRCGYCDTMWANAPGAAAKGETPEQLAAWVRQTDIECVTLTGGEPVLQPLLPQLVELLLGEPGPNERGLRVEIETNGAADLGELAALRARIGDATPGVLSFTVDWKLPSSGMEQRMLPANFRLLDTRDTVKFVCGQGDLPRALEVARQLDLPGRVPVYLSPCFGDIEPARIVEFMQENQMTWATAQVQLHEVIWPDVERGV